MAGNGRINSGSPSLLKAAHRTQSVRSKRRMRSFLPVHREVRSVAEGLIELGVPDHSSAQYFSRADTPATATPRCCACSGRAIRSSILTQAQAILYQFSLSMTDGPIRGIQWT
jgi:hypothetical protein